MLRLVNAIDEVEELLKNVNELPQVHLVKKLFHFVKPFVCKAFDFVNCHYNEAILILMRICFRK